MNKLSSQQVVMLLLDQADAGMHHRVSQWHPWSDTLPVCNPLKPTANEIAVAIIQSRRGARVKHRSIL